MQLDFRKDVFAAIVLDVIVNNLQCESAVLGLLETEQFARPRSSGFAKLPTDD